jgi:F-type H+-transporting ATPase subunit b
LRVYQVQGFYQPQDMDETLRQVGELLLGSVPTVIFLVLLYGIYSVLVHRPLVKVLAERHDKTEGAIEKASADIAAAEARTAEYEQRLREARMMVFKHQEALRQQALQARAAALAEAQKKAHAQVEQAREAIEKDKAAAQAVLQAESGTLAAEIIRIVLQPGTTPAPAGDGR